MTDVKTLHIDNLCVDELARGQHIWKMLYAKDDAAGGEKHTLLNMIETLCARLEGLQNLNKIEGLVKDINTNTAQNGELIKSVNTIVSALGITMENINQIADNTNSLMADYNELAKSVAEALKGVKDAVENSANANVGLTAAIGSLTDTQSQIQTLLGKIEDKLPEKKEGEGGETDPIQTMAENFTSLKETIETLISVVRLQNIRCMAEEVVEEFFTLKKTEKQVEITQLSFILTRKYNLSFEDSKIQDNFSPNNILYLYFVTLEKKDNVKDVLNYYVFNNDKVNTENALLDKLIESEDWFGYINTLYFNYNDDLLEVIRTVKNNEELSKQGCNSPFDVLETYCSNRDVDELKNEYNKIKSPDQKKKFALKALLKALFKSNATKIIKENIRKELNTIMIKKIKTLITTSSKN